MNHLPNVIEFTNTPPEISDIPEYTLKRFLRALHDAALQYKMELRKQNGVQENESEEVEIFEEVSAKDFYKAMVDLAVIVSVAEPDASRVEFRLRTDRYLVGYEERDGSYFLNKRYLES